MHIMETQDEVGQLVDDFSSAIDRRDLGEAEVLLDRLASCGHEIGSRPIYPTMLALAKGDAIGALQRLRGLDDTPQELVAICLHEIGDPTWEGLATELAQESPDPRVRESMIALLGH